MTNTTTYELTIALKSSSKQTSDSIKMQLMAWLQERGEDSFVEGVVDGLDLDFDYEERDRDYYEELGGNNSAVLLYKYDLLHLNEIQNQLVKDFGKQVCCSIRAFKTESWQEGWKESFKPFQTSKFYVYPPWESKEDCTVEHSIEIEPGMAFGTGQHATTKLCLQAIEAINFSDYQSCLDVGTGTGILSVALKKLGAENVLATDIDVDAVSAAKANAKVNRVSFLVEQGSVPDVGSYNLVVANILYSVIRRILEQLSRRVGTRGLLLLSGILEEEAPEAVSQTMALGFTLIKESYHEGWSALLFEKS